MTEPAWKRLVEDLTKRGYQSPHLDRLKERLPRGQGLHALEAEMLQEMAASLGRASEKVDHALLRLELLGHEVDEARDEGARAKAVARYNAQREVAAKALWELKVHREALGMRHHHALSQMFPIPPKRT